MSTMNLWGVTARDHWQRHRPASYAALENPPRYFEDLGQQAEDRYLAIRDGLLKGVNPNDGTIGWAEFQERAAQADQTAREIVEREMIYLPPGETDSMAAESTPDEIDE